MASGIIYKVENLINGKCYIGQTINFPLRKSRHIHESINPKRNYFHRAIYKYGKENFKWEILYEENCNQSKLNLLEIFFIGYHNTIFPNGYNLTYGGEAGWKKNLHNHPNKEMIYKDIGKKMITTMRSKGYTNHNGNKNPRSKKYLLIAPNGQKIGAWGNLKVVCEKYGLLYMKMFKKIDKGIIKENITHKNSISNLDWEIVKV